MLDGVPRIGWDTEHVTGQTERVVDRLVLEVLLANVHQRVASELAANCPEEIQAKSCFITWVPDAWTLAALRHKLKDKASQIRRIVYPGYGLTLAEIAELTPLITFHRHAKLVSFEEASP